MSVHSLNIAPHSQHELPSEKKSKRRSMAKMSSFVNMLSPATTKVLFVYTWLLVSICPGHFFVCILGGRIWSVYL